MGAVPTADSAARSSLREPTPSFPKPCAGATPRCEGSETAGRRRDDARAAEATLAIRAHVPLEVLGDTIQPFPSFSGSYDAAVTSLRMQIMARPRPVRPMNAQMASLSAG